MKQLSIATPGTDAHKYSVGSRIYKGFSSSPNFGKGSVNPKGYQDREKRAMVKRRLLMKKLGK